MWEGGERQVRLGTNKERKPGWTGEGERRRGEANEGEWKEGTGGRGGVAKEGEWKEGEGGREGGEEGRGGEGG